MVARVASTSLVSNSPLRCSAQTCSSRSGRTVSVIVTSFPPLAEKRTGDHHAVHFGRALADAAHSGLAVPALEGELLADAVAAVDLHRGVDHASEHLARIELSDGGLDPPGRSGSPPESRSPRTRHRWGLPRCGWCGSGSP